MKNSECDFDTNTITETGKLITAKDGTSWGKVSDNEGANEGSYGYYGVIGNYNSQNPESNNKYMKNSECAISTDSIDGYGPITTRDGSSRWGKISDDQGSGTNEYYGKIGTEDNDYIENSTCKGQKDTYLLRKCKLTNSDFDKDIESDPNKIEIDNSLWGKIYHDDTHDEQQKIGYYGKIGNDDGEYMITDNCHTLLSSVNTENNTVEAKDKTYWGKIGEDIGGTKHGDIGYYGLIRDEQGFYGKIGESNGDYGKIGTEDNDYIKKSDCDSSKDGYLSDNCKLTNTNFDLQQQQTTKIINIDNHNWGKIYPDDAQTEEAKNGYYGEIGSDDDQYMLNSRCAISTDSIDGYGPITTRDGSSSWGKVSDDQGSGITGYYGKIGTEDNDYITISEADTNTERIINDRCELLQSDVNDGADKLGISSITQRTWGKVSDAGGLNSGKNDYYGKIGSSSGDYGKIGDLEGDYGKIGAYDPEDISTPNKYMKNSDCAIEVKDLAGKNLVYAKDASQWGKVSEADGSGIGDSGNYGEIGEGTNKYMLYQNCELLQSDVDSVTNSGISTITQRTWGKVKESNGDGYGFNGYYGKIGDGEGNNEYGLIGDGEYDYMIREKCLYDDKKPALPDKKISLKNIEDREWGEIGDAGDEYITNNDATRLSDDRCEFLKGDVRENTSMSGKNHRTWGLIGTYGEIGNANGKYMLYDNCHTLEEDKIGNIATAKDDNSEWGLIGTTPGRYGKIGDGFGNNEYGKIGDGNDEYMLNSQCEIESKSGNTASFKDGSQWGKISDTYGRGGTDGYYGEIGGRYNQYMLNDNCYIESSQVRLLNTNNKLITANDSSTWGKVSNDQGEEGIDGYYGKIGAYDPGDSNTNNKYMLNSECAISTDSINGYGPITTRDGSSSWGKVSDADGLNSGKDNYYGKIGNIAGDYIPYETISELQSTTQMFDNVEIKNIVLNELLLQSDSSNKTIISGWVSGNIISGDDSSLITVFAYKCIKNSYTNKIYRDNYESSSILKLFKGSITHCVVDNASGSKRYIYFKDNNGPSQTGNINLSKQLGDGWTNENIGNNIPCEFSKLGCIEIEKKT